MKLQITRRATEGVETLVILPITDDQALVQIERLVHSTLEVHRSNGPVGHELGVAVLNVDGDVDLALWRAAHIIAPATVAKFVRLYVETDRRVRGILKAKDA